MAPGDPIDTAGIGSESSGGGLLRTTIGDPLHDGRVPGVMVLRHGVVALLYDTLLPGDTVRAPPLPPPLQTPSTRTRQPML